MKALDSKTTTTTKKVNPLLMLHGRILYRDYQGEVSDVTDDDTFGLKSMADDGDLAMQIISQSMKKLKLLSMAAESRSQLDAELVRIIVQDVAREFEPGSEVYGYVRLSQKMFAHSKALPPIPTPDAGSNGRSLNPVKPSS